MSAGGYSAAAIPAVVGSNSTPVITAPAGARPMKFPDQQPGSNTGPPVKPNSVSARHAWETTTGSV